MTENEGNHNSLKPKLLIVDDDQITIDVVKRILKNKYNVDSVNSGIDALDMVRKNDYDAFIIDIGLGGGMDGILTTIKIKELKDNKGKPFIALTAFAMETDREYFLANGMTHYISKPFEFQTFINLIESAITKTE